MDTPALGPSLRRGMLLTWFLGAAAAIPAQQLPLGPGDVVRVATGDSARQELWRVGRVLWVTREALFLIPDGGADSVGVALNESVRLAVARPSTGHALLWGVGGMGVGAALGATVLSSAFDGENLAHGRAMETFGFGSLGGLIGMVAGMAAGPRRWRDIPLNAGGIAATRFVQTGARPAQFGARSYWTSFPTTEQDFTSFFATNSDSLTALEGVYEILGMSARGQLAHQRVAIVRDARYEGFDYVAVQLPLPGATFPQGRGVVTMAFRPSANGAYDARGARGGVDLRVELFAGELILTRRDGSQEKWLKVYPVGS